jgi:endonuclease/exonuclease/phosphatase family metal-dependent hydrolase
MKTRLSYLTVFGAVCVAAIAAEAGEARAADDAQMVKILTFNIRYDTLADGKNQWPLRRKVVRDLVRRVDADFVGLQEALPWQLAYLIEQLPQYGVVARTREANPLAGEITPLLYRKSRWRLDPKEHGVFWLSERPDQPGSRSWNTAHPRIVTWGRFEERATGCGICVFNTHLDNRSAEARREGARLLAQRIAARRHDELVLVTGDFNAGESSEPIRLLKGEIEGSPEKLFDTFRAANPKATGVGTFHGFTGKMQSDKIDYIFASPGVQVRSAAILNNPIDGRWPSDHCPVTAEVLLPTKTEPRP